MGTESDKTSVMLAVILTGAALCSGTPAVQAIASSGGAIAGTDGSAESTELLPGHRHTRAVATWFGPGLYGRRTACGQVLTKQVLGVAHRTLPCGTLVRISYRRSSVVLPVIDRGPYAGGATWDLTARAAQALGLGGKATVAARRVGQVPNTPLLGTPPGSPASPATGGNAAS